MGDSEFCENIYENNINSNNIMSDLTNMLNSVEDTENLNTYFNKNVVLESDKISVEDFKIPNESKPIDEPTELSFDKVPETDEERIKRLKIEHALNNPNTSLEEWQRLAKENCGLVNDNLRRKVWPLLMEIDPNIFEVSPTLEELSEHPEYSQVILDVNRSLKRFPPGIPYEQRVALQDQLTILILRVILKYPHLRYYQGYHDVAITFLLVVGETLALHIMERLSTEHLRECMEPTMEKTSNRLNFIYPIIEREHPTLNEYLERSTVGTMFALPWYLTWFGHSLNQYRDVVRLYDYFLATPPLAPLYVAAALVIYRADEIFNVDCDMASVHCLLSNVPDNLPFEDILKCATDYYAKYPPSEIEKDVQEIIKKEIEARKRDESRAKRRQIQRERYIWRQLHTIERFLPIWIPRHRVTKFRMLFVTATVALGMYAYFKCTDPYVYFNR